MIVANHLQLIFLRIGKCSQIDAMDFCADGRVQRDDFGSRREKVLLCRIGTEAAVLDVERLDFGPLEVWVARLGVMRYHSETNVNQL